MSLSVILLIFLSSLAYLANSSIMLTVDSSCFMSWISALICDSCSASFCSTLDTWQGGGQHQCPSTQRRVGSLSSEEGTCVCSPRPSQSRTGLRTGPATTRFRGCRKTLGESCEAEIAPAAKAEQDSSGHQVAPINYQSLSGTVQSRKAQVRPAPSSNGIAVYTSACQMQ